MQKLTNSSAVVMRQRNTFFFRQIAHEANNTTAVRKGNVCLLHDNRNTKVEFLRALHVTSSKPSFKKSYWTSAISTFVILTLHSQSIYRDFIANLSHGSHTWQNLHHTPDRQTRTDTCYLSIRHVMIKFHQCQ